jgi:ribosome biogenesis GTPase
VLRALQEAQLEQDRYLNYLGLMHEAVGHEEMLRESARKKREIGRLQYLMRRDGHR